MVGHWQYPLRRLDTTYLAVPSGTTLTLARA